ncbi:cystathionine beta-synthase [Auriscalpium vulgare]|uniref:Cystathionine beta-synthase n=1 Tax=Auriscalpium vulgare TaxID=40419 RepID=A0ACB8RUA3_9AGAM|nr:cystathionine beta-synthase [Auriscalpium vulgare]
MAYPATIFDTALDAIGQTPLIRLDRIAQDAGLKCNLLGKLEATSPGGSVKDRVAKRMIEIAEEEGRLVPGKSVLIEPTSGNTGVGLAMAGAIKGYPVVVVLPQKMSIEKETAMRALGAEVVRTPIGLSPDSQLTHIAIAERLRRDIPGGVILDQYTNVNNPLAHELTTGPEIIDAVIASSKTSSRPSSGKVDVFVGPAGTGGTLTGVAHALKKVHNPAAVVVAVDVKGSLLALPESLNTPYAGMTYLIEGVGYDETPATLTREPGWIDTWVKTGDDDAFPALTQLLRREGLLVGGSSGSSLAGALQWLRDTEEGRAVAGREGANVVVLLPDGLRNYIAKDWFRDLATAGERTAVAQQLSDSLKAYVEEPGVAEPEKILSVNGMVV